MNSSWSLLHLTCKFQINWTLDGQSCITVQPCLVPVLRTDQSRTNELLNNELISTPKVLSDGRTDLRHFSIYPRIHWSPMYWEHLLWDPNSKYLSKVDATWIAGVERCNKIWAERINKGVDDDRWITVQRSSQARQCRSANLCCSTTV